MMRIFLILLFLPFAGEAQPIFKTDYQNFRIMRDSVMALSDTGKQLDAVNRLYIQKASDGLKAFMRNNNGLDRKWLDLIHNYPLFLRFVEHENAAG